MIRKKPDKRTIPIKINGQPGGKQGLRLRLKNPRLSLKRPKSLSAASLHPRSVGFSRSLNKKSKILIKSIPLVRFVYVAFILGILNIITILLLQNFLPPEVPLYYGLAKSQEQLTTSIGLVAPGIVTLGVTILNTFLAYILDNDFLKKILVLSAFSVSIISFIATIEIIFLVGSF